ncbi:MAG: phytoene/squalene synthase family protein [Aquincola tertiaricarbonis]|uniref:phytoene/squalene synthase family protein n=1 Tax=Aquincola TaxID=391952 RepID=UPI0009F8F54A|nr:MULTISPECIES: phytoene/squalene synthase family protein [Aquincola]MCR5867752.1 phytoene/squalene synthase family protein [Aquincola sp. J276]
MSAPPLSPLLDYAQRAITRGSSSFASAARLFDSETRQSVVMLYAWCRHCDDVVDGQQDGHGQAAQDPAVGVQRIEALADQTRRALRGLPTDAAPFAALAEVVKRHRIPERFPLEHLSGFRMDVEARRYQTLEDTLDYCYRVAGVVGVMMAMVMGRRDDVTLDRAADLGLAFQLTNIARDVIDDHAAGRLYLPAQWLAEEQVDPSEVAEPQHRERVARVAQRLVDAAEPYYSSAGLGIAALPLRSAWAVATARGVYREIGLQVKARGGAAWDQRISTGKRRKLHHLLAGGMVAAMSRAGVSRPPPMALRDRLWTRPRA